MSTAQAREVEPAELPVLRRQFQAWRARKRSRHLGWLRALFGLDGLTSQLRMAAEPARRAHGRHCSLAAHQAQPFAHARAGTLEHARVLERGPG